MNDEQTKETDTKGEPTNKPVENSDQTLSIVDEAKKVRDEIRAENDRREEILKQEQKLASDRLLGGTSGGHVEPKVETEDEKWKREAKIRYEGTGMDPTLE